MEYIARFFNEDEDLVQCRVGVACFDCEEMLLVRMEDLGGDPSVLKIAYECLLVDKKEDLDLADTETYENIL